MRTGLERDPRSHSNRIKLVLAATLLIAGIIACSPRHPVPAFTDFLDLAQANRNRASEFKFGTTGAFGEFIDPTTTWLDDNRLLVLRYFGWGREKKGTDLRLATYDVRVQNLEELDGSSMHHSCRQDFGENFKAVLRYATLIRNRDLAFIVRCRYFNVADDIENSEASLLFITVNLYTWNESKREFHHFFDFRSDGAHERKYPGTSFSFSPDSSRIVYGAGGTFSGSMYLIQGVEPIRRLVPDFYRATSPTWSSDGSTIAFAGVKTNAAPPPEKVVSFAQIAPQARQVEDLYLLNAADGSVRAILLGFDGIGWTNWLPQGNRFLSFPGVKHEVHGIWVVDLETNHLTRIWDDSSTFCWSPDGKLLVLDLVERTEDYRYVFQQFIVDSPSIVFRSRSGRHLALPVRTVGPQSTCRPSGLPLPAARSRLY